MVAIRRTERLLPIEEIKPNPRNVRTHSKAQVRQIAESLRACGFCAPVLVDETLTLIAGHGRLMAAKLVGMTEIPAIELRGLSAARKRALAIAELLVADDLEITLTGFAPAEIGRLQVDFARKAANSGSKISIGAQAAPALSARGSLWLLDCHRLLCGDCASEADLDQLMGSSKAEMVFLDWGPVASVKRRRARVGEPSVPSASKSEALRRAEFIAVLEVAHSAVARVSDDGTVYGGSLSSAERIAAAIEQGTRRGDIILDIRAGAIRAGADATLIVAERIGRRAYVVALDPHAVDAAVQCWQDFTAKDAVDTLSGLTFAQLAAQCAPGARKQPAAHQVKPATPPNAETS